MKRERVCEPLVTGSFFRLRACLGATVPFRSRAGDVYDRYERY